MADNIYNVTSVPSAAVPSAARGRNGAQDRKVHPPVDQQGRRQCYIGAFVGAQPDESETSQIQFRAGLERLEGNTGISPSVVMGYYPLSDGWKYGSFPWDFCEEMDEMGKIAMISLDLGGLPFRLSGDATYIRQFNMQFEKKEGEVYDRARRWAKKAGAYGKPFFFRPFWEANYREDKAWTAWENGWESGIEEGKEAWINLYKLFQEVGADNATFVWCPGRECAPTTDWEGHVWNTVDKYYPGDEYVDWLGVDGYRYSDVRNSFGEIFGPTIHFLRGVQKRTGKPIFICETSSWPDSGKAAFLTRLDNAAAPSNISGIGIFSANKLGQGLFEKNWLVDAPVLSGGGQYQDQLREMLATAANEQEKRELIEQFQQLTGESYSATSVNSGLMSIRTNFRSPYFIYKRVPITLNPQCTNEERPIYDPGREIRMKEVEKALRKAIKMERYMNRLGESKRLQILLEVAKQYIYLGDLTVGDIELNDNYYRKAQDLLQSVPRRSKFYLQALPLLKDMYMRYYEIYFGWPKSMFESEARELLRQEGIVNISDRDLIGAVGRVALRKAQMTAEEILKLADSPRYVKSIKLLEWQKLGYVASAHATLGDVELGLLGAGSAERAMARYQKALSILRAKESAWRIFWGKDWFSGRDRDLKISIAMGIAKISTLSGGEKEIDDAVKSIEDLFFIKGVPPRLRMKIRFELALALSKYAGLAQKEKRYYDSLSRREQQRILPEFRTRYEKHLKKAARAFILYQLLLNSELAYRVRNNMDDLSVQIK
jgi:hypothetical protein